MALVAAMLPFTPAVWVNCGSPLTIRARRCARPRRRARGRPCGGGVRAPRGGDRRARGRLSTDQDAGEPVIRTLDPLDRRRDPHIDPVGDERVGHDRARIRILLGQQARGALHERDVRAEPCEGPTELAADRAAAEHDESLGARGELPHRVAREHVDAVDPGEVGHLGGGAGRDDGLPEGDRATVDLGAARAGEPRSADRGEGVRGLGGLDRVDGLDLVDGAVHVREHRGEVDLGRAGAQPRGRGMRPRSGQPPPRR